MVDKIIEFDPFDASSIDKAIKYAEQLQKRIEEGNRILVEMLANIGVEKAQVNFDESLYAGNNREVKVSSKIEKKGNGYVATVSANGENVGFIEFGTGILNPMPSSQAMSDYETVIPGHGTYGKGQGFNQYGWWYKGVPNDNMPEGTEVAMRKNKNGEYYARTGFIHTYGNPANSCMHNAYLEMEQQIDRCIEEAFKL